MLRAINMESKSRVGSRQGQAPGTPPGPHSPAAPEALQAASPRGGDGERPPAQGRWGVLLRTGFAAFNRNTHWWGAESQKAWPLQKTPLAPSMDMTQIVFSKTIIGKIANT